ncbi:glycosyltransferase [Gordonia sp. ABSL49_1]|uniref:glycosyltransferase n=1 Tax=Gordonia sp. ABSL49_1 TaxID=2920941 RepID=UPI001F0DF891|nr:glycosyltransferase [Gordonia sp. ABSL49_1]MCH5641344.1 glycosyltransferase [Gordonia sp. ABSL49_1]
MSPRVTILAFGTRGDVAPIIGLAAGLQGDLGADVSVAAQHPYEQMVTDAGLEFRLLPRDTESDTRASEYGQAMVDGPRMRPTKDALAGMRRDLVGVGEAMAKASADADLVLCEGPVGGLLGWHAAQACGVRSAALMLQPAYPTGDFAPPALGTRSFGRFGNRTAWRLGAAGERVFAPLVDDLRASLGLPDQSRSSVQKRKREWIQLCGFSESVVARPRDWPESVHITGYWWPDDDSEYQPPAELASFLEDGPPPVYVGLGSTALSDGSEISDMVRAALRAAGRRGLVNRGWANLDGGSDDPDVLTIDDVPHSWLLPRVSAAIHHCGAGTTAATLRAGIPSVALPGIMDQPFWALRLHRLGCAPEPIPRTSATRDNLAAALSALSDDKGAEYRFRARELADHLAREDGVANAVALVERVLAGSA